MLKFLNRRKEKRLQTETELENKKNRKKDGKEIMQ